MVLSESLNIKYKVLSGDEQKHKNINEGCVDMGLFSKKNEDDFLAQQMKEEGRYSDFEEKEYKEVKNNVDAPDTAELRRNYSAETNASSGTQQSYTQKTTPSNPPATNNEPAYRQYRQTGNANNQQNTTGGNGRATGIVIFAILFFAGVFTGLASLIIVAVIGILAIVTSSKNNKK